MAVVVFTSGCFFCLCMRVGGTILLPMPVHGLWDFSLVSSGVGLDPVKSAGVALPILLQVVLIVVLPAKRRSIEPAAGATGSTRGADTAAGPVPGR
ncbi:hypothetical protein AB0O31_19640 [Kitasatospora cineracea]|uniref:hypothetical protein n=1 Tax=Kitasatospora cineracea TaxID=88074 RepID=UPI003427BA7A